MVDQITYTISKGFEPVSVPKGLYRAKIIEIRDLIIQERATWAITFRLEEGPGMGKKVDGLCSTVLSEKSKLAKWILALGFKLGTDTVIKKTDLLNKECRVFTDDRESEKFGSSSFVKDVLPL